MFTEKEIFKIDEEMELDHNNNITTMNFNKNAGCYRVDAQLCKTIRKKYAQILGGDINDFPEIGNVNDGGVCTLAQDFHMPDMVLNSFICKSPLCNYALHSSECAQREGNDKSKKYLNLYEIMIQDVPNFEGERSTVQVYVNELHKRGLDVAGVHFHWTGASKNMMAIHHQNFGMNPVEFAEQTAKALKKVNIKVLSNNN